MATRSPLKYLGPHHGKLVPCGILGNTLSVVLMFVAANSMVMCRENCPVANGFCLVGSGAAWALPLCLSSVTWRCLL